MSFYPIADLHSDLLSFLVDHPDKTFEAPESRSAYSDMKKGGLAFQALTLFSPSNTSAHEYGKKQLRIFSNLLLNHPDKYHLWDPKSSTPSQASPISVAICIENAYSLCEESQKIESALLYLDRILSEVKNILYISLTWDLENRFGGGVGSKIGLKDDGKILLEALSHKKIAVDLSHASDYLAEDILNFIEKKSLSVPVIASHSNMRSITPLERNLPDFLVKEIIKRKGLIGFNFFAPFIGASFEKATDHISHLISLGGENTLCFGADFFPLSSFSYLEKKYGTTVGFFSEFPNSSCYPRALDLIKERLLLPESFLQRIAFQNFEGYVKRTFT